MNRATNPAGSAATDAATSGSTAAATNAAIDPARVAPSGELPAVLSAALPAALPAELRALARCEQACVIVTVAVLGGSGPRDAGAKMVVTPGEVVGTIGGGHLEFEAIAIARELLVRGGPSQLRRFALGATLGQCCGGAVSLLFEPVTPGTAWLAAVIDAVRHAQPCVIVTAVRGGFALAKAVVREAQIRGTLGAPSLDAAATRIACAMLAEGGGARLLPVTTGESETECLFDPVAPPQWSIVLFGAGHVGQALVRVLADLPCAIEWVDTREAIFPQQVPGNATVLATDCAPDEVDRAPAGAHFVVMTHSHALDQELAERILRRNDFAYFGLIGSMTKRRLFEQRLCARGLPRERLARMTCPIGVRGIEGKEPAVIALAVAAELLQVREATSGPAAPGAARAAGSTGAADPTPPGASPATVGARE